MQKGKGKQTGSDNAGAPEEEQSPGLVKLTEPDERDSSLHVGTKLRNYFLTGLIVVGPVGITLYIAFWFINLVDAWVKPYVPTVYNPDTYLPFTIPGIGLVIAIFILMVVGALTANLFGRTLLSYGEMMLGRMPVVRNVYRALKQIFETVLSQSNNSFQQVGLIEYPRKGLYAVVFISKDTGGEIKTRCVEDDKLLSVFLPTTPNPTSGYLLFVPEKEITLLDMTVEDAAKMVISAGLVEPEHQTQLGKLAKNAKSREHPGPNAGGQPKPQVQSHKPEPKPVTEDV